MTVAVAGGEAVAVATALGPGISNPCPVNSTVGSWSSGAMIAASNVDGKAEVSTGKGPGVARAEINVVGGTEAGGAMFWLLPE